MRPGWQHLKTAMLVFLLLMTLGALWSTARLERNVDRFNAEVGDALVHHSHGLARLKLQIVLNRCSWDADGFASVERDPCRIVCWSAITNQTIFTESLDEGVCKELR